MVRHNAREDIGASAWRKRNHALDIVIRILGSRISAEDRQGDAHAQREADALAGAIKFCDEVHLVGSSNYPLSRRHPARSASHSHARRFRARILFAVILSQIAK